MPSFVGTEDKADCFHGSERSDCLPEITGIEHLPRNGYNEDHEKQLPRKGNNQIKHTKTDKANNNSNCVEFNMNGFIRHESRNSTSNGSARSSFHFKLPVIDLAKSYKVSDGVMNKQDRHKNAIRGKDRSLAKPLSLSNMVEVSNHQNKDDALNNSENLSKAASSDAKDISSHISFCNDEHLPTLPKIFHKGNLSDPRLAGVSMKSNNSVRNSRDESRLSLKPDSSITEMSGQSLSLVGRRSKLCHRNETSVLQKSRPHISPLLLPISVHIDLLTRKESKGKRTADK